MADMDIYIRCIRCNRCGEPVEWVNRRPKAWVECSDCARPDLSGRVAELEAQLLEASELLEKPIGYGVGILCVSEAVKLVLARLAETHTKLNTEMAEHTREVLLHAVTQSRAEKAEAQLVASMQNTAASIQNTNEAIERWQKAEAQLAEAKKEIDTLTFAAHMPRDYEYGLPSWICQRLYRAYIAQGENKEHWDALTVALRERDEAEAQLAEARKMVKEWTEEALKRYPLNWAFDATNPALIIDNIVRGAEAQLAEANKRAEKAELRFKALCQQADERDSEVSDQFTLVANAALDARLRAEAAEARAEALLKLNREIGQNGAAILKENRELSNEVDVLLREKRETEARAEAMRAALEEIAEGRFYCADGDCRAIETAQSALAPASVESEVEK
jgi:hypothetical protein